MHITRFPSPGRKELFRLLVASLVNWIGDTQVAPTTSRSDSHPPTNPRREKNGESQKGG